MGENLRIPQVRRPFQLPMTMTITISESGGQYVAHALDFDIVSVGETEEHASNKLALAVKTYIEYGLSKGWSEDILFPAPAEYWDRLSPETPVNLMPPIPIDDRRMLVMRAIPAIAHGSEQATCTA